MQMAGGVPVLDPLGYPMFKVVTIGRNHLPAPFTATDTEAPRRSYYERITKTLLDSNARSQAMMFNLSRECTLIEFQNNFLKFAESFSIKSLFESVWINGKEWQLVSQPFYTDPTHIPIGTFSNADRSYEKNYANSWQNDHNKLEAAVIVLMKHMINKTARPNISIVEDVRDKASDPFVFYQAIKQALIAGEGSAESIRAKCNAMTGIDFNLGYDFLKVKRLFEDLFLKFKSKNGNVGFTDLEKVKFLTKLYERCDHSAVSNLNDTLKNAILVGNIRTWDQATKIFEDQESELKQEASDMVQAKQLLSHYEKKPSGQIKMYQPTVNALTHEVSQVVKAQTKPKSTVNLAHLTNTDSKQEKASQGFIGICHKCGVQGHTKNCCPKRNYVRDIFQPNQDWDRPRSRSRSRDRRQNDYLYFRRDSYRGRNDDYSYGKYPYPYQRWDDNNDRNSDSRR